MNATDIVGYTYKAENLHPSCLVDTLARTKTARDYYKETGVEGMLDSRAKLERVDRGDECSFDSDDFPKVIFADQVIEGQACDRCGEGLVGPVACAHCSAEIRSSTMDEAYPWLHRDTGNAFCDVSGVASAVANCGLPGRTVAEPSDGNPWEHSTEAGT